MTSVTYQVAGLTCEHCAHAVSSELKGLGGVRDVRVELAPGGPSAVTVTSTRVLPQAAIADALAEAGDYRLVRE